MSSPTVRTLSRYELREEIGRGNMGVVYRAHDPVVGRTVAIKIVRFGFSLGDRERDVFVERFHREARIAGNLSHPSIVAVHDFGSGDEPFLVMEYFPGVSLQKLVRSGPLPLLEVQLIARQVAEALAYAHSEGVVHRDIKPANVLYHDGQVKLVDFGIARLEASELTATGEFIGTPSYMSPEVFSGAPVDGRSDLFSLGVVLYQLLTGRKPFEGETVSRTIYRVLHEEPLAPSRLRPGLSTEWDVIVRKLMAKNPTQRYRGAEDLIADLDRLSRGERVERSRDDDPTELLARPGSPRAKVLFAVSALIALVVVIGFLFRPAPGDEAGASPAAIAEELEPSLPALAFVARHEHGIGHCTGDLTLDENGVTFDTSRHRGWRWRIEDVESLVREGEQELEMRARSPERGKKGALETYRFTFLRPALSRSDFERYVDRRGKRESAE